ncbi:MAG: SDR family oxidoreductase [Pseudomonadota bacterium]
MDIKNRIAVVTGGASGIGRALCQRFAQDGAKAVVAVDLNLEGAQETATGIGDVATAMQANVGKEEDIQRVIEETEKNIGPIDIFCGNAGIGIGGGAEVPNDKWQLIWDVNVMAHIFAARHLIPKMLERGGGYFLNTASAAGLLNQIGSAPYGVTKHAAVSFAEWIAITYGDKGVGVSVLCPQAVRTGMTAGTDGGVAGLDGMLEPEVVAAACLQAIEEEKFLVLPHPEVLEYMQRKTADYDRWIGGMQRLRRKISGE